MKKNNSPPGSWLDTPRYWLIEVDRILRGQTKVSRELFRDSSGNADIRFPVGGISVVLGALGIMYGLCMGVFSLMNGFDTGSSGSVWRQFVASTAKVPLLFLLTTAVTFPSLYVFNAIVGSSFRIGAVFRLLVASLVVNLCVLASLGPVVAFFSLSSPNYSFIVLLHVFAFAIAGCFGLGFMIQTLRQVSKDGETIHQVVSTAQLSTSNIVDEQEVELILPSATGVDVSVIRNGHTGMNWVFAFWMIAFGLVGAQMGWVLRPFVGSPHRPFSWFRARESNFFEAVWTSLQNVFS